MVPVSRSFPPSRGPQPAGTVLAVGQRVFVNCPADGPGGVVLTDERGKPLPPDLRDGAEVEVLAWRPRGSSGTRYRVRLRGDGADGWLAADQLRATATPPPTAADPVRASTTAWPGFGARR